MFSEQDFDQAADQINDLIELTELDPESITGPVLDLGCGPGRHSIPLQATGFNVTGIDISPYLIERANQNAHQAGLEPEFQQSDMRTFNMPNHYALACCLWSSFGYSENEEDDLKVLKQTFNNLKSQGKLLLDVVGKEYAVRNIEDVVAREMDNGITLIERAQLTRNMYRLENHWTIIDKGEVDQGEWGHWIYSGRELTDLVKQAGFSNIQLFGSWDKAPYDIDSERLILLAEKTS